MGESCPEAPSNAAPRAFLINKGSSEGTFQKEFVNGEVQHGQYFTLQSVVDASISWLARADGLLCHSCSSRFPPPPVICIEPTPGPGEDGLPRRLRDSPLAIAAAKAALAADPSTASQSEGTGEVDAHLTEALVMYQMSVLQAVGKLEGRVHDLTVTEEDEPKKKGRGGKKEKSPFS